MAMRKEDTHRPPNPLLSVLSALMRERSRNHPVDRLIALSFSQWPWEREINQSITTQSMLSLVLFAHMWERKRLTTDYSNHRSLALVFYAGMRGRGRPTTHPIDQFLTRLHSLSFARLSEILLWLWTKGFYLHPRFMTLCKIEYDRALSKGNMTLYVKQCFKMKTWHHLCLCSLLLDQIWSMHTVSGL